MLGRGPDGFDGRDHPESKMWPERTNDDPHRTEGDRGVRLTCGQVCTAVVRLIVR